MKTKTLILLIASAALLFTSCQKDKEPVSAGVETSSDIAYSELIYNDTYSSLDIATTGIEYVLGSKVAPVDSCPLVMVGITGTPWPVTVTIDYGTGCTGSNDIVRTGKIIITQSAPRTQAGSVRTLTFNNFYFNGTKLEGTYTVTNEGLNDNSHVVFSIQLTDGKVTLPDGKYYTYQFTREREYLAGFSTRYFWDDECLITGSGSGTGLNGLPFTYTITSPLDWKAACRFIVSGVVKTDIEGYEPIYLDYGNGDCDSYATLTQGDVTKTIKLRLYHPHILGK
ncbi:MAG TPA: hypothetical protein PKH02_02650 [Bacteroidales bacterium]|nr:hypothetical protein [Bacteroidales bacterium]HPT12631.1 hypothetical protein [Bacteroidales bacterium]